MDNISWLVLMLLLLSFSSSYYYSTSFNMFLQNIYNISAGPILTSIVFLTSYIGFIEYKKREALNRQNVSITLSHERFKENEDFFKVLTVKNIGNSIIENIKVLIEIDIIAFCAIHEDGTKTELPLANERMQISMVQRKEDEKIPIIPFRERKFILMIPNDMAKSFSNPVIIVKSNYPNCQIFDDKEINIKEWLSFNL